VYAIDPWEDAWAYRTFQQLAAAFEVPVVMLKMTSHEAVKHVPVLADMVFIDGDHSNAAVDQDIRDWSPKTRVIAGHDYHWPDVRDAVHAHFDHEVDQPVPNVWIHTPEVDYTRTWWDGPPSPPPIQPAPVKPRLRCPPAPTRKA